MLCEAQWYCEIENLVINQNITVNNFINIHIYIISIVIGDRREIFIIKYDCTN